MLLSELNKKIVADRCFVLLGRDRFGKPKPRKRKKSLCEENLEVSNSVKECMDVTEVVEEGGLVTDQEMIVINEVPASIDFLPPECDRVDDELSSEIFSLTTTTEAPLRDIDANQEDGEKFLSKVQK